MTLVPKVPATFRPPAVGTRRRPKDRKAQIARAAAEAFSEQGYRAASMEDIAARVGISAPALYRHYASKYEMFAAAALALSRQLVDCTAFVDAEFDADPAADPAAILDRLIRALVEVALDNRESGGLYRWQDRYLRAQSRATLLGQLRLVNTRIQRTLLAIRPALAGPPRWMLSSGLLSVIGSIVDHRVVSPEDEIRGVLTEAASALLAAQLPPHEPGDATVRRPPAGRALAAADDPYEALLHAAMVLFGSRGYAETTMVQIAEAAGVPGSAVYRQFSGKSEILATGLRRAADRISDELAAATDVAAGPRQTLTRLVDRYVAMSFANPEVAWVYYTEHVNLEPADQALLRGAQRSTIDSWSQLLTADRPDLGAVRARLLVHAAMALVIDLGRLVHYDRLAGDAQTAESSAYPQACVRALMERILFDSGEQPD